MDLLAGGPYDVSPAGLPDALGLRAAVRRAEREARTVACVTDVVEQAELVPAFTSAVLGIRDALARQGARFGVEHWVVYHERVRPGMPGRIETRVPYEGPVVPAGDLVLRLEAPRTVASVGVPSQDCRYPRILPYYDAVFDGARAWGGPGGPPREVYPVPWSDDAAEVARVEVPLRR